jgi:hypothetical protein
LARIIIDAEIVRFGCDLTLRRVGSAARAFLIALTLFVWQTPARAAASSSNEPLSTAEVATIGAVKVADMVISGQPLGDVMIPDTTMPGHQIRLSETVVGKAAISQITLFGRYDYLDLAGKMTAGKALKDSWFSHVKLSDIAIGTQSLDKLLGYPSSTSLQDLRLGSITAGVVKLEDLQIPKPADTAPTKNATGCATRSDGSQARHCIFGGAFLAALSLTLAGSGDDHAGQTSHQIASLVVPTIGYRWMLLDDFALDLGTFTTLRTVSTKISTDLAASPDGPVNTACNKNASRFEAALPCEGNATLSPYVAFYLGLSAVATKNLGIAMVGLTAGLAHTNGDTSAHPFYGLLVTAGSAYVTYPAW